MLDHIDLQVHEIGQHVAELAAVLAEFRPLLAVLKGPGGKPDMVGAAQAARRFRRGRA